MAVTVVVSKELAPMLGAYEEVVADRPGLTVAGVLEALEAKHPKLRDRLMEGGELRPYVKIRVGGKEIWDLAGLHTSVRSSTMVEIDLPPRARVTFVQEHRTVETEPGRTIKEIALEAGIDPNRKYQRLISCEGLGIFDGCKCWVKAANADALSPRSWSERAFHALTGWQRLACQARVFGDVEVWTMPQGDERLREPRPIAAPPPRPAKRERPLESIFRSPAPEDDDEEADAKPAAKRAPPTNAAAVTMPNVPAAASTSAPPPANAAGEAAAPSNPPIAPVNAAADPAPITAASEAPKVSPDDTGAHVKVAVIAPIVKAVEARSEPVEDPVDRPARDHAEPSEGQRTSLAESKAEPSTSEK